MSERQIVHEITPLLGKDALYIADRRKKEFEYPIHNHDAYELNFVENAAGVRRIVGDSVEIIGDYDLVLITSPELEHVWEQHNCTSPEIREITIQFQFGLQEDDFFEKNPFAPIRRMLQAARKGLFATSSYAKVQVEDDSRRILKVKDYIIKNYPYELKLQTLADIASMSQSAFSRFFKLHTGRTLSDYIIDIRLGYATRMLLDTNDTIADISFKCGYNNLSNFNRTFRRKKGCTPKEFRENFRKIRIIV